MVKEDFGDGCVWFRSACSLGLGYLHHAEEVAIGIFQDDKVIARFISPRIASRSDLDEPLDLAHSVVCIEVEVQSTSLARALFRKLVQRQVGPSPLRIAKNHPAAAGRLSGDVVERLLPECQHFVELITADDNRTDLHFSGSVPQSNPPPELWPFQSRLIAEAT